MKVLLIIIIISVLIFAVYLLSAGKKQKSRAEQEKAEREAKKRELDRRRETINDNKQEKLELILDYCTSIFLIDRDRFNEACADSVKKEREKASDLAYILQGNVSRQELIEAHKLKYGNNWRMYCRCQIEYTFDVDEDISIHYNSSHPG